MHAALVPAANSREILGLLAPVGAAPASEVAAVANRLIIALSSRPAYEGPSSVRNLQRDDLDLYRQSGHIVLEGRLARRPVYVVITPDAQKRMLRREIDEHEILDTLATPPEQPRSRKSGGAA